MRSGIQRRKLRRALRAWGEMSRRRRTSKRLLEVHQRLRRPRLLRWRFGLEAPEELRARLLEGVREAPATLGPLRVGVVAAPEVREAPDAHLVPLKLAGRSSLAHLEGETRGAPKGPEAPRMRSHHRKDVASQFELEALALSPGCRLGRRGCVGGS